MYGKTQKPHCFLFYRYGLIVQSRGKTDSVQFIHHRVESHYRLNVQFSGMYQIKAQILDLPFQAELIPAYDSLQVQRFFNGESGGQTVHPAFLLANIEKIYVQVSSEKGVAVVKTYFFHCHVPFILDHSSDVRLRVRHIIIHIKSNLTGRPVFYTEHLNIFFS